MTGFIEVLRKDLRLELRSGQSTISLIAMSLLVLVVLVFALNPAAAQRSSTAAGALWVSLVFSGMLGAASIMRAETENGCSRALVMSPMDPATLYAAKLTAVLLFMVVAEIAAMVMLVLFFNLDFDWRLVRMGFVVVAGAVGFAALSTLVATISGNLRAADLLLPLLVVPMFAPALIAGVKASAAALAGSALADSAPWLKILAAFDLLFVAAGYLLFEHVVRE